MDERLLCVTLIITSRRIAAPAVPRPPPEGSDDDEARDPHVVFALGPGNNSPREGDCRLSGEDYETKRRRVFVVGNDEDLIGTPSERLSGGDLGIACVADGVVLLSLTWSDLTSSQANVITDEVAGERALLPLHLRYSAVLIHLKSLTIPLTNSPPSSTSAYNVLTCHNLSTRGGGGRYLSHRAIGMRH